MKETSINTNEEVNEKTDLLLNIENKGGADKYKNRIDALFKEFEHDAQNFESKLSSAINFSEKECVMHPIFGKGTIISIVPLGNDSLMEINFEKDGRKKIMANYANLKKI